MLRRRQGRSPAEESCTHWRGHPVVLWEDWRNAATAHPPQQRVCEAAAGQGGETLNLTATHRLAILAIALAALVLSLNIAPVAAQDNSAPAKPTGLTAKGYKVEWSEFVGPYVALEWNHPRDNSITHYEILRHEGKDKMGTFQVIATYSGWNGPQYFDRTVDEDSHYVYRIRAVNEHGKSPRSKFARANTTSDPMVPYAGPGDARSRD